MGCGLALAGPQGGFQFFAQTVVFPLEPFFLPLQLFDLLLLVFDEPLLVFDLLMGLIQFSLADELDGFRLPSTSLLAPSYCHPPYCNRSGRICPANSRGPYILQVFQCGKKIRKKLNCFIQN
jgi:hypothetical protein